MSGQQDNEFSLGNHEQHIDTDSNENNAKIGHSGNSDVDIQLNVQVDTRPIAYAILCSLLATKQMTNEEFATAVQKMDELTPYQTNNQVQKEEKLPEKASKEKELEKNKNKSEPENTNRHNPNNYPGFRLFGPMRRER